MRGNTEPLPVIDLVPPSRVRSTDDEFTLLLLTLSFSRIAIPSQVAQSEDVDAL